MSGIEENKCQHKGEDEKMLETKREKEENIQETDEGEQKGTDSWNPVYLNGSPALNLLFV